MVQEAEDLLSLSWGFPSSTHPPALPSLRGSYVLHPHPHPRPRSFLSPTHSFLHHRVTPGPDIPCSGSGLEPVRNQSAPFTQVRILPKEDPKGPGSRSPEEGPCFRTALGGCRQTSFLCSPPASEPAAHTALRTRVPGPHLFLVLPSWAPPPQLRLTIPRHLCSRQGSSVMEALGPQEAGDVQATLSQNSCCSRSTGPASALLTVSAVGLLPCLL